MIKLTVTLLVGIFLLAGCGGSHREPAAAKDVPAGFETLQLTVEQAKSLNEWLAARKPSPDPAELAQYLDSLLRGDQKEALEKLLESAVPVDPNGP